MSRTGRKLPESVRSLHARLRRQPAWLAVPILTIAALAAALIVTWAQEPIYRAQTKIVIGQGGGAFQPVIGTIAEPFTQTLTTLLESERVAQTVISDLRLDMSPEELLDDLHASSRPQSFVLNVTYDDPSRTEAVRVLRSVSDAFTETVDQTVGESAIRRAGASGRDALPITAAVFDPARPLPDQVSPRPARNLAFAGALGLALGILLAVVLKQFDHRVRGPGDARRAFALPILGVLPGSRGGSQRGSRNERGSMASDRLRALQLIRARLQYGKDTMAGPCIAVTSPRHDDGKTALVADLGVVLAAAGADVICVEADPEGRLRDRLWSHADLRPPPLPSPPPEPPEHPPAGAKLALEAIPVSAKPGRLRLLPAGHGAGAGGAISSLGAAGLIEELAWQTDYVLVDTPSLLEVGDAFPMLRAANGVIVVATEAQTTRSEAQEVRAVLEELGVKRGAVVLIDALVGDGSARVGGTPTSETAERARDRVDSGVK